MGESDLKRPNGCTLGQRELLIQEIRHDRTYADAYRIRGITLATSDVATRFDGRRMRQRDVVTLFDEAARPDPGSAKVQPYICGCLQHLRSCA